MLPISVPTYVAAYAYYGMFGSAVVGKWGIIIIFSVVLYPYIYLFCLAGFFRESRTLIETARSLGSRTFDVFRRVQFPMSRPALISGLWLVCMDTVNDYGAVDFFGINTNLKLSLTIFNDTLSTKRNGLEIQFWRFLMANFESQDAILSQTTSISDRVPFHFFKKS